MEEIEMDKEIKEEYIQEFNDIWHYFIFNFQNKDNELWGKELKDATTIEISILNIIDKKPDVMLKEIKGILEIPGSTLTNAIDRLEKKGLIKRVISKRDRRSFGLMLTAQGQNAQEKHIKAENQLCESILGALDSDEERKRFLQSLNKIKKKL